MQDYKHEMNGAGDSAKKPAYSPKRGLTSREIDELLAQMEEEAIAEEIVTKREIEEARRPPWWMFGFSTQVL